MTDQHRAKPEHWLILGRQSETLGCASSNAILELRARIEALEATQHAHADLSRLSDAEREQIYAEMAKPAAWRPLDIETTYGTAPTTTTAQQILRAPMVVEGTFEHGGETYRFKAKPERDAPMAELRAASAEARPTVKDSLTDAEGLVKRVAKSLGAASGLPSGNWDHCADASIREVAAWLDTKGQHGCSLWLREEADRG